MSAAAGGRPSLPAPARTPVAGPRPAARATLAPRLDPAAPAGSPAPVAARCPRFPLPSLPLPGLPDPRLSQPGLPYPSRPAPSRSPAP